MLNNISIVRSRINKACLQISELEEFSQARCTYIIYLYATVYDIVLAYVPAVAPAFSLAEKAIDAAAPVASLAANATVGFRELITVEPAAGFAVSSTTEPTALPFSFLIPSPLRAEPPQVTSAPSMLAPVSEAHELVGSGFSSNETSEPTPFTGTTPSSTTLPDASAPATNSSQVCVVTLPIKVICPWLAYVRWDADNNVTNNKELIFLFIEAS